MFVYSYSIKIHTSGFDKLVESIFCLLLVVDAFSLQEGVKMLEEVVVSWWAVRWTWWIKQNLIAQFVQLLKQRLCDVWSGIVLEKNWALSVDQSRLQVLKFSVHLIYFLNILLRCNGFAGNQKAVVDQTGSRPLNSAHDLFMVQVWLWEVLWSFFSAQPLSWLSYKIHFSLHITIWSRNGLLLLHKIREDNTWFFDFQSAHEAPTYWAVSPFQFTSIAEWLQNGQPWVLRQLLM